MAVSYFVCKIHNKTIFLLLHFQDIFLFYSPKLNIQFKWIAQIRQQIRQARPILAQPITRCSKHYDIGMATRVLVHVCCSEWVGGVTCNNRGEK